ncbi:MAG: gluconate 2-dehydrogenase subunit 3 family protein [Gemmatimonadota bacterium]|nr:gluconate 2-dehydrogenase subunit 3 family protein [Gemmatimonadota bacterium]
MTEPEPIIDRREAIRRVTAVLGGAALVGGNALITGCRSPRVTAAPSTFQPFTASEIAFLDEVADTILPDTKTPGAKAAKVGALMAVMVTDCYDDRDQQIFRRGMLELDSASRAANGSSFMSATPAARLALLQALDREQKAYMDKKATTDPAHYFRMIKELTLLGYFTSEIGYTQAQRYVESPGRYDPCLPHTPGERSWASHA